MSKLLEEFIEDTFKDEEILNSQDLKSENPFSKLLKNADSLLNFYDELTWINNDFKKHLHESNEELLGKITILTQRVNSDIDELITWTIQVPQLTPNEVEKYNKNLIDLATTFIEIGGRIDTLKERNEYYADVYPDFLQLKNKTNELNVKLNLQKEKGVINFIRAKEEALQRLSRVAAAH